MAKVRITEGSPMLKVELLHDDGTVEILHEGEPDEELKDFRVEKCHGKEAVISIGKKP